jgi:PAS domain S-box-containing protein
VAVRHPRPELLLPLVVGLVSLTGSLVAAYYRASLTATAAVGLALLVSTIVGVLVWVLGQGRMQALALLDSTSRDLLASEERFRSLAASAPLGIFQTDNGGSLQYANRRFHEVAGLEPGETLCSDWLCIAHPDDIGSLTAAWRTALAAQDEFSARFRVPTGGSEVRWVQVHAAPMRVGTGGEQLAYVGSMQNITGQVHAYELRQRLAAIVESSDDAILSSDLDGTITSWNPGAERLYGWPAEQVEGRHLAVLAPPGGADAISAAVERVLRLRRSERYEAVVSTRDGRRLEVSLTTSATKDPSGNVIGTSTIARDVTERKRAERELAVTAAALRVHTGELERSNAELAQFAYVASHDLSEPLRMISSYVQLLAKRYQGRLDDDADEFIAYAVDGANRMQALINDLLAYSRVGRGGLELAPVDCGEVVAKVLRNLEASLEESGAEVEVGELPVVDGDASQLGQLFQNLIANAVKFRRPGDKPHIVLAAAPDEGGWRFSVTDNGIGIEPQYAERVFSMFQRLHGRDQYAGTGIGLSICRKIVELHGGHIWVEPAPAGGSRFLFTLRGGVAEAAAEPAGDRGVVAAGR